jgi:hypothetical protein
VTDEPRPSPAFQLWSAICIFYLLGVAWWAFFIVGPRAYSLGQWVAIIVLPPLAVIIRGYYMKYVWGTYRDWFWGRRR